MFNITKAENSFHYLFHREIGNSKFLKKIANRQMIRNIYNEKKPEAILPHPKGYPFLLLEVQDRFAVTTTLADIQLWDFQKHLTEKEVWTSPKCRWTFPIQMPREIVFMVKIVGERVICCTHFSGLSECENKIRLLDLQEGSEKASIPNEGLSLQYFKMCTIGERIFAICKHGKIGEWDLNGKLIQLISSTEVSEKARYFLSSGNFLVCIYECLVVIHNIQTETKLDVDLSQKKLKIFKNCIDNDRLICSVKTYSEKTKTLACMVMDLENGAIINEYTLKECAIDSALKLQVTAITTNKGWAYLGCSNGQIMAIHLAERIQIVLGQHPSPIHHLASKWPILISGSVGDDENKAQLKFWNIKSQVEIAETSIPQLYNLSLIEGKVFATAQDLLIQWNYLENEIENEVENKTENHVSPHTQIINVQCLTQ